MVTATQSPTLRAASSLTLLRTYLAPQRIRIVGLFILMLLDLVLHLALPRVVQAFIDSALAAASVQTLLGYGVVYLIVAITQNATWVGWQSSRRTSVSSPPIAFAPI